MRKLDLNLTIADPRAPAETIEVTASIGISDPNVAQEIAAPANPRPITELAAQFPDNELLGGLGGIPATGGGAAGGQGSTGSGAQGSGSTSSGVPDVAPSGAGAEYFECVGRAQNPAAVEACADLLGG